jgi:hypothetical protein
MTRMGRPGLPKAKHTVAVAVVVALAAATLFVIKPGSGSTPPGQPALVRLDTAEISRFDADFDAACDQVRVLVLLSPT